ncbi:hypothetical protein [Aestuariivivens sp. NBU2969]|nr:hypothetical protein [Aestuariivivens sp. NBU2969]
MAKNVYVFYCTQGLNPDVRSGVIWIDTHPTWIPFIHLVQDDNV